MITHSASVPELKTVLSQFKDGMLAVFEDYNQRLQNIETVMEAVKNGPADDPILNVRQTAQVLGIEPASVRKARTQGRLRGVKINEKEWGFYKSEIDRYLNRYNRPLR